jgi:diguanylate cyclase (GGDEF)-like protein
MILSAIFNDKKLLDTTFGASVLILMTVAASFLIFGGGNYICFFSLFILVGFAAVSYFCGRISINFSNSNYLTIKQQAAENDRLQEDVLRDQMTGLYDHTAFMDQLEALVETEGNGRPFCLVMMDLDDFKTINDRFGHDSGDDVLIFMGKTLLKHCGKSDTAYRYGGEEFALILRDRGLDDSYEFVLQVLAELVVHRFEFTNSPVTFSAGIARYQEGDTMDSLFERADQTLYRAKNDGKKRIYKAK